MGRGVSWIWIALLTALVQYVVSETLCLIDVVARWLIRRSVERLPEKARARYTDEWEGELRAIPGSGLLRLLFAVRVRLDARSTARALGATSQRLPLDVQLVRFGFMVFASAVLLVLTPLTIVLVVTIASAYGRPILRSRVARTRDEGAVTLYSFNVPASSALGRFLDRTDLDALPSLVPMARGRIWPTVGELRVVMSDLRHGRPTQPFRDRSE
jgi:hypothetical protein